MSTEERVRHRAYNGWCLVVGIPLHARDCPACVVAALLRVMSG